MKVRLLQVSRFTRSAVYQPLAATLALCLMPTFAWMESTAGIPLGESARSFQSSAQIVVQGCTGRGNLIIQNTCVNGTPYDINGDLTQLESDAVNAYLIEHKLPPSDAALIYSTGRTDLRNAIRGQMLAILLSVISEPANLRTNCGSLNSSEQAACQHNQMLYNWMQALVQQFEIEEYQTAYSEFRHWQLDPCDYIFDPVIAAQFNLSSSRGGCIGLSQAFQQPVPTPEYFLGVGLERSYGAPSQTTPDFGALVSSTGLNMGEAFAISTAAGTFLSGTASGLTAAFYSEIFPFATWGYDWVLAPAAGEEVAATAETVAEAAASGFQVASTFIAVLGPALMILLCVIVAGLAIYETINNKQDLDALNNLVNQLAQVQNTPPDLTTFVTDTSGLGDTKLTEALVAETLPEIPSTSPLPAHNPTDPVFVVTPEGGTGKVQNTFTYYDWTGQTWQATTAGGWFDLVCEGGFGGSNCTQSDAFNADIHYIDWSGKAKIASRLGNNFIISDLSPSSSQKPCPADPTTGLSTAGDFSTCSSYVSNQIQYLYQSTRYTVSLTNLPEFTTNSKTIYFTYNGAAQTATVTAAGNPAPALSLAPGSPSLPYGLFFSGVNSQGSGTFQYLGFGTTPPGSYPVTLQAINANGSTTQNFTIVVAPQLQITSPGSLTASYGQQVSFTVTTTGLLPMSLSINALPAGLTFHDNGNGTATISGTPTEIYTNQFCYDQASNGFVSCFQITAQNGQGTVSQFLYITINPPPQPQLGITTATFIAGADNTFTVTTTGATTPVAFSFNIGTEAPSWLTFQDNGNGTGTLTGTPPRGTSGSYAFDLTPYANIQGQGVYAITSQTFTINVSGQPMFLSPNTATFTVPIPGSFTIVANQGGTISEIGTLPAGLEFTDNGNGTATISGTPLPGTYGVTPIQVTITGNNGTATQALNVQINETVLFASAPWANFYVGQENSFPVEVSGYPLLSSAPASQSATAANYVPGVQFSEVGLPSDLSASNLNPEGFNTGTLIISGNPSSADLGQHAVNLVAYNGINSYDGGPPGATQTLTLNIAMPGDVNGDGVANCTDLNLVKASFGTYRGQPGYNPAADLNNDGVINVEDLALVSKNLPEGTACR